MSKKLVLDLIEEFLMTILTLRANYFQKLSLLSGKDLDFLQ